jgi:ppGpp synthetase/RelA/SpoT-type nucleotidyltranferase
MAAEPTPQDTPADSVEAKPAFGQYSAWLVRKGFVTSLDVHRNHYEAATRAIVQKYKDSDFWQSILSGLRDVDAKYLIDHKYPLIAQFSPDLTIKSWRAFFEKTYRKNMLNNANFPSPPTDGWIMPDNWYTKIRDTIRTTIIVKYLDGVPLLVEFLREKTVENKMEFEGSLEARVDGYYGAQCLCSAECEIPGLDWTIVKTNVSVEIQVTTTMKDVIKRLLHSYYEARRVESEPPSQIELSWNYKSDEFITTYLGHILHYVEGMILDVRDRKRG